MSELEKTYNPAEREDYWYNRWLQEGAFHSDASRGGEPFCMVIPPPNVTGILHMGHALNNTIQDILIRWKRMQGCNTVWVPGTDHAGIATQNVVEKALRKEKKSRDDLGRDAFIERVWQWKEQYGNTIISQLKKMGTACDWDRTRFTMDEGLSNAVAEVFIRLYEKKLIYRGNYIINWCPRCHTALSDEESAHQNQTGKLYYIRYPLKGRAKKHILVATTRPETLLGDTAVAVNPRDERYAALVGKTVILPVLKREIPVIADDHVDPAFGTGAVKVTPAHDANDFDIGQRHSLAQINVMNGDATMNENAGPYQGQDRFECRKAIVADLQEQGLIEKIDDHPNAVGHCYRCDTVIEPRLSPQWFVRMKPLARPALEAVREGRIKFVPERWNKVYIEWMENIRDWCISRQIWWGHRIPVFYCDACNHEWAAKGQPDKCPACAKTDIRQDEDVLDTWFSSWLWPFSVFGWPDKTPDLKFYYPTHTLVTASEIIFFWVARMVMAGMEFMGDIPFRRVYIHGTVRDDLGRKMSKSLGNSINPLDIIQKYSADALRFSLMMITATGQDIYVSDEKFEIGRNFGTKLWNAARFLQMHAPQAPADALAPALDGVTLSADDIHILAKLQETIAAVTENLDRLRFNDAALVLHDFFWHHFCDWYVEYSKPILYGTDAVRKAQVTKVMHHIFASGLRLLHPFMPFITEELWHGLGYNAFHPTIQTAPWPVVIDDEQTQAWGIAATVVEYVDAKHDLIRVGRTLKADCEIPVRKEANFFIRPANEKYASQLLQDTESLRSLLKAGQLVIDTQFEAPKPMPSALCAVGTIFMPLEGLVDIAAEKAKLTGQLEKMNADIERVSRKLDNLDFVSRAPEQVVAHEKERRSELIEKSDKLRKLIAALED